MSEAAPTGDIVLVVDDSPEALGFLTRALEEAGVTVLVATSGEAALTVVQEVTPDVILMDGMMPGLDGFETCRRLKEMAHLAHVPVIFMTALTQTEHVVHALECGGVDFLTKPIDLDELRARMRVHLANARRAQSAQVALDAAGRHLIALGRDGRRRWMTPQADRLIDAVPDRLGLEVAVTEAIRERLVRDTLSTGATILPLPDHLPEFQLIYLGHVAEGEYLFRLIFETSSGQQETLRQHFDLTPREAEVLFWIARGKANRDIAELLELSPRTVNKHLEQIYIKLGVENRASAAVKAMHVLG
ncbi:response regulator transcription factor [Nitratireductor basaltis]|uniref:Two-component response regulator n=1 Tax=Nitratireductor basaltis TaxID=472175 RepID=A0A084U523_9HYPH|nr:response regulator transcription factor [Nitratireductor basaltis]KFB08059.1 Two-component response regulator [Nitratireductor basaltis]